MSVRYPNPPPEPGVYEDVPEDEYHKWEAVNYSTLSRVSDGLKQVKRYLDTPRDPPTCATQLGNALHVAILQPDRYEAELFVLEGVRTASGRLTKKWKDAIDEHPNLIVISEAQYEMLPGMLAAVNADPLTRAALYSGEGLNEVSIVWDNSLGLRCKARLDRVKFGEQFDLVIDAKGCRDTSDHGFTKACIDWGYVIQMPHYLRAHQAAAEMDDRFAKDAVFQWALVRTTPAFDAGINEPDEAFCQVAPIVYGEALRRFARAWATDKWPGMVEPGSKRMVSLFGWYMARFTDGDAL